MSIFSDTERTPLRYVSLRNSSISDEGMEALLRHKLISLSLWYCDKITSASWRNVIENGGEMRNLELGKFVDMLKNREPNEKTPIDFQINLPKLKRLVLNGVALQASLSFENLFELAHLDLSACLFADFSLTSLSSCTNLKTLILFNVWPIEREISTICSMKQLMTLDLSHSKPLMPSYTNPNKTLEMIVTHLSNLEHLDISGTNL
jgi:Zyg-11 protein homolog